MNFISLTERFDTSTPSGRLLRNIILTFAQFERELASERTKDKMLQRAGIPPYGYRTINKKLIPDKKEAETVRVIFETYVQTGSIAEAYKRLKIRNTLNRNGNTFTKSCIHHILGNVIYIGKIRYAEKIYD